MRFSPVIPKFVIARNKIFGVSFLIWQNHVHLRNASVEKNSFASNTITLLHLTYFLICAFAYIYANVSINECLSPIYEVLQESNHD